MSELTQVVKEVHEAVSHMREVSDRTIEDVKALGNSRTEDTTKIDNLQKLLNDKEDQISEINKKLEITQKGLEETQLEMTRPPVYDKDSTSSSKFSSEQCEYHKTFIAALRKATNPDHVKTLQLSDDEGAGFLASDQISNEIINQVIEISPIRQLVSVMTTSKQAVTMPKREDIPTAFWVDEADPAPESQSRYGLQRIPVNKQGALVLATQEMLDDADFDMSALIQADASIAFAKLEGQSLLSGDAQGEVEGLLTTSAGLLSVPSGISGDLSFDSLVNLLESIKSFYSSRGTFIFNRATREKIRLLKDGELNFLWQPVTALGLPATIFGRPIVEASDMPDPTAGNDAVLFGDFKSCYKIVDRKAMTVKIDPFTEAAKDIIRYIFFRRFGGQVVLSEAAAKLTIDV